MTRLACALIAFATLTALASPASAAVERHRLRYGPITIGGYSTVYPGGAIDPPPVQSYVTRMHARLVDARGRPLTIRDVMLHHIFFHRGVGRSPSTFPARASRLEAFYGTGEEDQRLRLPEGYGYRLRPAHEVAAGRDAHVAQRCAASVYIEYTVHVETTSSAHAGTGRSGSAPTGATSALGYSAASATAPLGSTHEAHAEWTRAIQRCGSSPPAGTCTAEHGHVALPAALRRPAAARQPAHATLFPPPLLSARPILHEPARSTRATSSRGAA